MKIQELQYSLDFLGKAPELGPDEIHIWGLKLVDIGASPEVLDQAERERLGKISDARARQEFIQCKEALRRILGRYLARDPASLRFKAGEQGKPTLEGVGDSLEFNLSHSGGFALFAFARGRRVGIDLERVRTSARHEQIAQRMFQPAETEWIRSQKVSEQLGAFFKVWSAKEALIKAFGSGVFAAISQLELGYGLVPVRVPETYGSASDWVLVDLLESSHFARLFAETNGFSAYLAYEKRISQE